MKHTEEEHVYRSAEAINKLGEVKKIQSVPIKDMIASGKSSGIDLPIKQTVFSSKQKSKGDSSNLKQRSLLGKKKEMSGKRPNMHVINGKLVMQG